MGSMTATRTRPSVTAARRQQCPWAGVTFHLVGDLNVSTPAMAAGPQWRTAAMMSDLVRGDVPIPDASIQLGDGTDDGSSAAMTTLDTSYRRLVRSRLPAMMVMGNQDTRNQTAQQWASKWGYATQNYVQDVDSLRVIVIGPDKNSDDTVMSRLSAATLAWLDQQLTVTTKTCIIACHYPLWDTVASSADTSIEYTSKQAAYYLATTARTGDSQGILDVLAKHSNVKAWFSSATHSSITVPGLVMPVVAGSTRLAHVNVPGLWYQGKALGTKGAKDDVVSAFATWHGNRLAVRYRHHQAGQWYGPESNREFVVTGLG